MVMRWGGSRNACWVSPCLLLLFGTLFFGPVKCADKSGGTLLMASDVIYGRFSELMSVFTPDIKQSLGFCIKDVEKEWNAAFDFSGQHDFLASCMKNSDGDLARRLCTAVEIKFYFSNFFQRGISSANYLKPNKNCNLTSWVSGCEPGWGCSVGEDDKVDLKEKQNMPLRIEECQPCCEGFFCPPGLTCMMPCPLGAYCPLATLNKTTGTCDPYGYQVPPGQQNHTCGGADIWADATNSSEIFCSAGSYCPSTTQKLDCSSGHYCRKGSTEEIPCFKLTTCHKGTEAQNIHAYGIMLIVVVTTLLIIIYNCSDQILTTREKRKAKSREAAARHARETAQARERWKTAKDNAKKHAFGLQQQFSRTFSRRKSTKSDNPLKLFGQSKNASETSSLGTAFSNLTKGSELPPKSKEPSNLTKMIQEIDDDPNQQEGFHVKIGDKHIKKQQVPKGKQSLHTKSQIFKYAYGQIEKEKAQQDKNLTFSGVISMATDEDIRKRPVIEVAFKDLTLTLKGKKKHLLRCVTGKLSPGRVSAVMGPSGAGKTTFLSALAGKATGCNISGMILINGKNESILSYKKIIGFVPQDDIVHGNLTVEENLRFSARCRLPADLPKADKVLIIERVIESLGLQGVRDSLVGTVEKRGISGGQRKRVNVGLEMVMEPSLLILDEPTSGLDSSSSMLLLRALRRESLEGVNISMVLHQPSYTLFKMFDDLILLAKGGLIAYQGSAKKCEEYFATLGVIVPERMNPPDHFIDVLEGISKPPEHLKIEQLPVRWMLHNGYPVPPDMLKLIDGPDSSSSTGQNQTAAPDGAPTDHSFAGELWHDMVSDAKVKQDHVQHNFASSMDLSNRITPGVLRQFRYFLGRVGKQRLREAKIQAVDYLILLLAGACLGTLAKVNDETFGVLGYTYSIIAVSLLCKIAALRSFTLDRLEYLRETEAGISSLAYFLSKDTLDHFNTIVKPLVYLSMFYFFSNPRSSFLDNYLVLLCLVYCVTGIAYILAIYLEPSPAQLWSVLLPVVMTLIARQETEDRGIVRYLAELCYPKWALEAFIIANTERYSGIWLISRCTSLQENGYDLNDWNLCLVILSLTGLVSRLIAFMCLVTKVK